MTSADGGPRRGHTASFPPGLNPHAAEWQPRAGRGHRTAARDRPVGDLDAAGAGRRDAERARAAADVEALLGEIDRLSSASPPSPPSPATAPACPPPAPPVPPPAAGQRREAATLPSPTQVEVLSGLAQELLADAACGRVPVGEHRLLALRAAAGFIAPEQVAGPLAAMVLPTWRAYPADGADGERARRALAELVAEMIDCGAMPRAQVLAGLATMEAGPDWPTATREVPLAGRFMDDLRARLDLWRPLWRRD